VARTTFFCRTVRLDGRILLNRADFSRSYDGFEINLMKRLSNKWMARVGYENLWNVDFRLAKNLKLGGSMNAVMTADLFNAFNANTELNRVRNVGSSTFGRLDELLSPRVVRFGMRLQF
jgi:hypothetical protein